MGRIDTVSALLAAGADVSDPKVNFSMFVRLILLEKMAIHVMSLLPFRI
jgi:hypothetical protein